MYACMYGYQARVGPCIQLFQERWSEKVHATIPKGIVGDFEFTVFQKNFKEWHEKPWNYVCDAKGKRQRRFDSDSVRKSA